MPVPLVNRQTNTVEQLDETKAAEALRSGKYALRKGQQVPVVNGAGELGTLDAEALAKAGPDIRFALPSEIAQHEEIRKEAARAEEYGGGKGLLSGYLNKGIASAEGGIRGATMGLSDLAATTAGGVLGGEEGARAVREHLSGYKEENSLFSTGAEIGGAVAPVILSGGAAGAGMGVGDAAAGAIRSAGLLPRATAAVGGAIEGGVTRALGSGASSALGRIAARTAGRAAAGAFEGGAYGLGSQISEDALGDHELTAEKALAAVGHGAFLGGVAGGLLGGTGAAVGEARDAAGRFLSQLRPKDVEGLAEKQFGHVAPGLGDAYAKAASLATGQDVNVIKTLMARRNELANIGEVRAQASRDVRGFLDTMLESNREITDEAKGVLKAEYVKKAVRRGHELEVGDAFVGGLNDARGQLQQMLENPKQFGEKRVLSNAMDYLDDIARRADEAMVAGGGDVNAKLFMLGDEMKRAIGRWTKGLQAVERQADPLRLMRGRATRDRFQELYETMRKGLEDEGVWGRAAADQRTINEAWSKQIDAHRVFDARLTTNVGRDPRNPWVDIRRVDPAKADAYVAGLTNPNNDLVHTAIRTYVDSTKSLAEAVGRAYELPPEKIAHVARVGEAARAFGQSLARAEDALTLGNQFAALRAAESGSGIGEASTLLGALGHPIVGALGQIVGAVTKPATTIARLAALERLTGKVSGAIDTSVRGFFRAAGAARPALRAGGNAVRASGPLAFFGDNTREERRRLFDKEIGKTRELAANPDRTTAGAAASLSGMHEAAPKTAVAMSTVAARGASFLATKMPPGMVDTKSLTPHLEKPVVSDAEMARFMRYASAVDRPETVLKDFERGVVSPEQVEALRAVYPGIYSEVREKVIDRLVEQKSPLPYGKRVELGLLFGVPTDATLDPAFLRAVQGVQAPEAPEPMAKPAGARARGVPVTRPLRGVASDMRAPFSLAPDAGEEAHGR